MTTGKRGGTFPYNPSPQIFDMPTSRRVITRLTPASGAELTERKKKKKKRTKTSVKKRKEVLSRGLRHLGDDPKKVCEEAKSWRI